MSNTKNNTVLLYGMHSTVLYFTLVSDGSQETAYVLYDSSAIASNIPNLPDPLNCSIQEIRYTVKSSAGVVRLDFDASTDVLALPLANNFAAKYCFRRAGGLKNYAGTGRTGDILLTTTGLASGDMIFIEIDVRPTA